MLLLRTLLTMMLLLAACTPPRVVVRSTPENHASHSSSAPQSHAITTATSAMLAPTRPLQVKRASIPDFSTIHGTRAKKRAFFAWLSPIVAQENARIIAQRTQLLRMRGRGWTSKDIEFLQSLTNAYKLPWHPESAHWIHRKLLRLVDIVPSDLVLAQAAIESAWGRSRFATQGNNLFGEWCFSAGCGLVPLQRNKNAHHEVRFFAAPNLSVRAYLHNINSGKTYVLLRSLRQKERQLHQPISGYELALGLRTYSERGIAYVRQVRHLIQTHQALLAPHLHSSTN
ncbi:MAG: glucosaminidase domain-containing protein [Mariprofundales bacterium]|nr:glucosaminidase domain-containing protein [Mariprofundales bacterium]